LPDEEFLLHLDSLDSRAAGDDDSEHVSEEPSSKDARIQRDIERKHRNSQMFAHLRYVVACGGSLGMV
jgi:hypothetical protein